MLSALIRVGRRLLGLPVEDRPATDFVTVVYTTRDKYAGMSEAEIRYHAGNHFNRG